MKTAVQTGPRTLEVREVAEPTLPDDGLILHVKAVGVCGSDLRRWRQGVDANEFVPGHEVAGVVEAVGPDVTHFRAGDRLAVAPDIHCNQCWYCQRGLYNLCDNMRFLGISPEFPGGFAEKLVLPNAVLTRGIVHAIPDGLGYDIAAMAEPCSSVLAAHAKTNTSLNDFVVIIGAGPIGVLLAATAQLRGARAVIVVRSETRRRLVERFSPDAIIDLRTDDMIEKTQQLTEGRGADIVICANPDVATQTAAVHMTRKGGKIVLFGGVPKSNPMASLDSNLLHYGEREVIGSFSYHPTMHALALDLYRQGALPIECLITHRFPLDDVAAAFETANDGVGLKVLVEPEAIG
ncbi:MAG: alcohol dehydrogenase catalytic domain-containing protein [Caldilineaceae bacterium]|nr:alcohol dehydrogenase catalytic domain-containing protein [Caldilineaceae bacterium]